MLPANDLDARRRGSWMIFWVQTALPPLVAGSAFLIHAQSASRGQSPHPTACYAVAVVCYIAALGLSLRIQKGLDVAHFQSAMILSLLASELSAIYGFIYLGMRDPVAFAPIATGSFLLNTIFIRPRVAAYWG